MLCVLLGGLGGDRGGRSRRSRVRRRRRLGQCQLQACRPQDDGHADRGRGNQGPKGNGPMRHRALERVETPADFGRPRHGDCRCGRTRQNLERDAGQHATVEAGIAHVGRRNRVSHIFTRGGMRVRDSPGQRVKPEGGRLDAQDGVPPHVVRSGVGQFVGEDRGQVVLKSSIAEFFGNDDSLPPQPAQERNLRGTRQPGRPCCDTAIRE